MPYQVNVVKTEEIANGTMAVHLSRPRGFKFAAGQNIDLIFPDLINIDPEGESRIFSIASAPHEEKLTLAARIRNSPFKSRFARLKPGESVIIDGPYGEFGWDEDISSPAVFIAGGIGITPILSMLRQAVHEEKSPSVTLFYANRTLADAAYFKELKYLSLESENYRFIPTLTRKNGPNGWHGETGHIDIPMLRKYVPDLHRPYYYLVGSTPMVWGTVKLLDEHISRDRIRVEDFTGF